MKKSKFWEFFSEFGQFGQFHPRISVLYVKTGRYLFKSEIVLSIAVRHCEMRRSLTLHPLGGSTPRMWQLFLLRANGKR
jgi:hypothetical protein